jgi:FKBP-type peptidyl-prolyl cis-trans isomerase
MKYRLIAAFVALVSILVVTSCDSKQAEPVSTEGYTTTESGLQYKVIEEGTGESPIAWDLVTVHYEGRLLDGTVFDSTYEKGKPTTLMLSRVIDGWTEGVQLMKEGATYHFVIPPELAYGDGSAGPLIKPNSTLWFQIELIDVK